MIRSFSTFLENQRGAFFIMKKLLFPVLLFFTIIILAACGSDDSADNDGGGDDAADDAASGKLAELQDKGVVKIGFANEEPYGHENDEGELTGARSEEHTSELQSRGH